MAKLKCFCDVNGVVLCRWRNWFGAGAKTVLAINFKFGMSSETGINIVCAQSLKKKWENWPYIF